MSFEPEPDIYALQQDVLTLLTNVSNLMGEVKDTLNNDESSSKYNQYQQEINEARNNVEKLELRMAVVAPMKAGKSTIINAIIGDDLLPSRNAAMTTIPTEIVLKKELTQPVLILSERIREIFKECYKGLNKEIQTLEANNQLKEKTGSHPHLQELINEIHNLTDNQLPDFLNSERIEGKENIGKNLTSLNDIVRLASILAPEFDPIEKLTEVPRIETGFCEVFDNDSQSQQLGNLVIVDTPGANEAGENLKLSYVVEEQLEKCSVVLIVLDFTQLNSKVAEGVKRQIKPIIDLRGKENLYVLVNKIDQRRKGDMTDKDVIKFVFNDLDLTISENTDRVFEISARKAFCANKFLFDVQRQESIDEDAQATQISSSEILAQEVFGMQWEEDLENATIANLQKKARKILSEEKSGFQVFVEKVIYQLIEENNIPKIILSSLYISSSYLVSMRDELILNKSAIKLDERQEILKVDLWELRLRKMQLKQVKEIRANSNKNLLTEHLIYYENIITQTQKDRKELLCTMKDENQELEFLISKINQQIKELQKFINRAKQLIH